MNEDQLIDAAEREMDLYRNEVTRITAERDDYAERLKATDQSWAKVAAERDGAYRERARLVAFLAAVYPSEIIEQPGKFADEWPVIYVDTPAGQLSWHLSRNDLDLFDHVRRYIDGEPKWDGHTTEEKYERLAQLIPHALDLRHEQARPEGRAEEDVWEPHALELNPPPGEPPVSGYCRAGNCRACIGPPGEQCAHSCHAIARLGQRAGRQP